MTADKMFVNGRIYTVNADNDMVEVVCVKGDRIVFAGLAADAVEYVDASTAVVDLDGKTMLPGFYDSHGHINSAGENELYRVSLACPPLGKETSIATCIESLREFGRTVPIDEPIYGVMYDDTLVAEKRHLLRQDLDMVSTECAVFVRHISGHLAYANTKALALAGYDENTPDPIGGVIQREDSGFPNGVLEETACRTPIIRGEPFMTKAKSKAALKHACKMYAAKGVTTGSFGIVFWRQQLDGLQELSANDELTIRIVVNPELHLIDYAKSAGMESKMLTIGGIKELHDGSLQGFTGYLTKPYYTPFHGDAEYRSYPTQSREVLCERITEAYRRGCQPLVHCNGDAALDDYLDAIEVAKKAFPDKDLRPVVVHCQTAREDQLDRMQALGVMATFFVLHTYYWGDRHVNIFLGPERGNRINPLRSALRRGIPFTTHCDTPITPQEPLLSIWAAVNRLSFAGNSIGAEQCIDVLSSVRAYTIQSAYQNFEESSKGSIEVGKLADFVVLRDDPFTCDPMLIRDIVVDETIVGGKSVFKAVDKS